MDEIFHLQGETQTPVRPKDVRRYRPTARCVVSRIAIGALAALAGAVCLKCSLDLGFNLRAIANSFIVLLGLCHILDGLVTRLSVDEDAIEIRTLSGVDILWRDQKPEARARVEGEIQRWRETLSLRAEDIARVPKPQITAWAALSFVIAYGIYGFVRVAWVMERPMGALLATLAIFPFLAGAGLWAYRKSRQFPESSTPASPLSIAGVTGRRTSGRVALVIVMAALANTGIEIHLPNQTQAYALLWKVTAVFYVAFGGLVLGRTRGAGVPLALSSVALLWYLFGAALLANAAFDNSRPVPEQVEVLQKRTETQYSRRGSVSWIYHFQLHPWSVQPEGGSIEVSKELYDSLRLGDRVCFGLYDGRLGVNWYRNVAKCTGSEGR